MFEWYTKENRQKAIKEIGKKPPMTTDEARRILSRDPSVRVQKPSDKKASV